MKSRLKSWRENPQKCKYRPYFPFAEDTQVEAEVIGRTALNKEEELIQYCATLTQILQQREIKETHINQFIPQKIDLETSPYTYIQEEDNNVASSTEHNRSTEAILCR